MLTVTQNGQPLTIDYTTENNLIPTIDELKDIMKQMFYFGHLSRNDPNSYNNNYNRNLNSVLYDYYLYPGLFQNGSIRLYDDTDNVLASADLYNAFSGTDTTRATVNINESKLYNYNNSINARLVIDLQTHVGNGSIKKLKFFSKPIYDTSHINYSGSSIYNYKSNTIFCGSDIITSDEINNNNYHYSISFDKNNNIIIVDGTNDIICYNNNVYKYTGNINKIYNIQNDFYIVSSIDNTNKIFILKNVLFDNTNFIATIGTKEIHLPYTLYNNNSYSPVIMNIVEINSILYTIYCDTYYNYPCIVKYNNDLTINVSNVISTSINRPISMFTYILNSDNFLYFSTGNDPYYKLDIANAKLYTMNNTDFFKVNSYTAYWNIYNLSNVIRINQIDYWIGQGSYSYSPTGPFMILQKNSVKVPLIITFNTPIIKTSDQTLKFILDINIK